MKHLLLFVFALLSLGASAQQDSSTTLSFEQFFEQVRDNHPVALQAELQTGMGEAGVLKARGAFDPKALTEVGQKYFKGDTYYSLVDAGFKIPTWYGIEFKGGYEQNGGKYLNPENTNPEGGLLYAGLSVTLGQGLLIDQRRAELQKAKLYQESTEAERRLLLNELLYESGKAYWDWFLTYGRVRVFEEGLALAEQRFNAVRQGAQLGDKPSIDTLEAGIQVQNRQLDLQQAQLDFANASALLSVFLWAEGVIPLELEDNTVPVIMEGMNSLPADAELVSQLEVLLDQHPELQQYRLKAGQLAIDRRLKKEQLKPMLNLKYNAITEPVNPSPFSAYSPNNFTWGLEFKMPVLLRKERGDLQMAELKLQGATLDIETKRANLLFKARSVLNEWTTTQSQIELYRRTVQDYQSLVNGERRLFDIGESSLFLVNYREVSYLKAKVKLVELLSKNRKASLAAGYTTATLLE